jgi:hypothetical protein
VVLITSEMIIILEKDSISLLDSFEIKLFIIDIKFIKRFTKEKKRTSPIEQYNLTYETQ